MRVKEIGEKAWRKNGGPCLVMKSIKERMCEKKKWSHDILNPEIK